MTFKEKISGRGDNSLRPKTPLQKEELSKVVSPINIIREVHEDLQNKDEMEKLFKSYLQNSNTKITDPFTNEATTIQAFFEKHNNQEIRPIEGLNTENKDQDKRVENTFKDYLQKSDQQIIDPRTGKKTTIQAMFKEYNNKYTKIQQQIKGGKNLLDKISITSQHTEQEWSDSNEFHKKGDKYQEHTISLTGLKKGEQAFVIAPTPTLQDDKFIQEIHNDQPIECYTQYTIVIVSKDAIAAKDYLAGGKPMEYTSAQSFKDIVIPCNI